jgi:hypothetical protein
MCDLRLAFASLLEKWQIRDRAGPDRHGRRE